MHPVILIILFTLMTPCSYPIGHDKHSSITKNGQKLMKISLPCVAVKYLQLCSGCTGLPVNQFSKRLCKMESPGKYKENETNSNLLQLTV
jgi:hypothetical protein